MTTLTAKEANKIALGGFVILGVVTLVEVFIALIGKGYLIKDFHLSTWVMYSAMIALSLYKAYYIIMYFMHLKFEDLSLRYALGFPIIIVIWAIIAFLVDGRWYYERKMSDKAGFEIILPEDKPNTTESTIPLNGHKGNDSHNSKENAHH